MSDYRLFSKKHKETAWNVRSSMASGRPAKTFWKPGLLVWMFLLLAASAPSAAGAQDIIYVDADATGGSNNGTSWADAYTDLQDALANADRGDQIWVADGIYMPIAPENPESVTASEREATFQLLSGVEIYGGFAGGEENLDERDWGANPAILSGDIDGNDGEEIITDTDHINGENSIHVVTASGTDNTARLDGFTITAGLANGAGVYSFGDSFGGGMYNGGYQDPVLANLVFAGNRATGRGGGMFNGGTPTLANVLFTGNSAGSYGGGMYNSGDPILTNATFSGNSAESNGGAIFIEVGNVTLLNAIVWGNSAGSSGNEIYNFDGSVTLEYSLYSNGSNDIVNSGSFDDGDHSLTVDPQFVNAADPAGPDGIFGTGDDGLALQNTSPAINAGDPDTDLSLFPADAGGDPLDLAGEPRLDAVFIDIGAYEFQGADPPVIPSADNILYVDRNVSGGNHTGDSWSNAIRELRDALAWADEEWDGSDPLLQIWVADGIYMPIAPENPDAVTALERMATFQLLSGVEIYGGFAGGEENLDERNWEDNPAILSGDIDGDDEPFDPDNDTDNDTDTTTQTDHLVGDNSIHVVTGSDSDNTARLDGFTITAGLAIGVGNNGAGMLNHGGGGLGDPVLANLIFTGNRASDEGGGMFNGGNPTLTNVVFTGNSATYGGGMFDYGNPTLTNVVFTGNSAGSYGGGILIVGYPTLANVLFTGNNAGNGGGIYIDGYPTLTNVTLTGNSADDKGGGIYNNYGSVTLLNAIVWGNSAGSSGNEIYNINGGSVTLEYSLYRDGDNDIFVSGTFDDGDHSLTIDPQFVDAADPAGPDGIFGTGDDGLALQNTSPAINAGDPDTDLSLFPGGPGNPLDLAGEPRVFDGAPDTDIIDIGAYEFQGEPTPVITLTVDEGWRMLSSPIDGLTYDDMVGGLWTQGVDGADYEGGENTFPNVYTWDLTFADMCPEGVECEGWVPPASLSDAIPAGAGFIIFVFSDDNFEGTPEGFSKTITLFGATHAGDVSPSINTTPEGWTLVGNPYGRPIAFSELDRVDVKNVAYVYDPNLDLSPDDPGPVNGNGGAWRSIAGDYGDIPNGYIAPGQGFFVQTAEGAVDPRLTFSESDQTGGGEFYGKENELARRNGSEGGPRDFVRLEVQGESLYNSVWIRFSEKGSLDQTTGEALELQPLGTEYAMLAARKAGGTLMDIAHYPLDTHVLEIPLAVEATQSGSFTIRATGLDLPAGMALYLYDRQTGKSMPIDEEGVEYAFTLTVEEPQQKTIPPEDVLGVGVIKPSKAKTTSEDRFVITTSPGALTDELPEEVSLAQNYPNPFNPTTQISFQLPANSQVLLEVYDMLGRQVAELVNGQAAAGRHTVNFNASGLSSGVYLYRLQVGSFIMAKKLTVVK